MGAIINLDNGDGVAVIGLAGREGMTALAVRDNQSGLVFVARANRHKLNSGVVAMVLGIIGGSLASTFYLAAIAGIYLIVDFIRDSNRLRAAQSSLSAGGALPAAEGWQ